MDSIPSAGTVRSIHPCAGAELLHLAFPAVDDSHRLLQAALEFVPGAREFLVRFGDFVQALPDPFNPRSTIYQAALQACLDRLSHLGLSPVTVEAHVSGLPVVVRTAASFVDRAFSLSVVDSEGAVWDPLCGPLASFCPPGRGPLLVSIRPAEVGAYRRRLARLVVLGHCLAFPQVAILADRWDSVAPRSC